MKFTANSKGHMSLDLGAKSCTTTGHGVFAAIFGGGDKNTKTNIKDLENQGLDGDIELFVNNSISMDIDIDEFKELSQFRKENTKFLYNGVKKFLDDIINGIKNRGKEIVDAIGDVNKDYLKKKAEIDKFEKELKEENK